MLNSNGRSTVSDNVILLKLL